MAAAVAATASGVARGRSARRPIRARCSSLADDPEDALYDILEDAPDDALLEDADVVTAA